MSTTKSLTETKPLTSNLSHDFCTEVFIPSLTAICLSVLRKPQNVDLAVKNFCFIKSMEKNAILAELSSIWSSYIRERYAYLEKKYDRQSLVDCLGAEHVEVFEKDLRDRLEAEKRIQQARGSELERLSVTTTADEAGFYPYEALRVGVNWPSDVPPQQREQYLSPEEFISIFGMSKETFGALPFYKRIRLKQEKGLF